MAAQRRPSITPYTCALVSLCTIATLSSSVYALSPGWKLSSYLNLSEAENQLEHATKRREKQCVRGSLCAAIFIARWGNWPNWTPLLLKTLASNTNFHFLVLSDVVVAETIPDNVFLYMMTLDDLVSRMQRTVGLKLKSLNVKSRFKVEGRAFNGKEFSSAKTNDLKPLFGEAFADLLEEYDWWGYLQEDVVLGDLSLCATSEVLQHYDVLTPYGSPFHASGVFMLMRNVKAVNSLWRKSTDTQRLLSDPGYLVFDEWWGESTDNFPSLLGREVSAGRLRLRHGDASWFAQDLNEQHSRFVCWKDGNVYVNMRFSPMLDRLPCFGSRAFWLEPICIYHIAEYKKRPPLKQLRIKDSASNAGLHTTQEFVIGPDGVWMPSNAFRPSMDSPSRHGKIEPSYYQFSSGRVNVVPVETVRHYLERHDMCDDLVENELVAYAIGLPYSDGRGWCWRQRSMQLGKCRTNTLVKALCVRTCGLCPSASLTHSSKNMSATSPLLASALELHEAAKEMPREALSMWYQAYNGFSMIWLRICWWVAATLGALFVVVGACAHRHKGIRDTPDCGSASIFASAQRIHLLHTVMIAVYAHAYTNAPSAALFALGVLLYCIPVYWALLRPRCCGALNTLSWIGVVVLLSGWLLSAATMLFNSPNQVGRQLIAVRAIIRRLEEQSPPFTLQHK